MCRPMGDEESDPAQHGVPAPYCRRCGNRTCQSKERPGRGGDPMEQECGVHPAMDQSGPGGRPGPRTVSGERCDQVPEWRQCEWSENGKWVGRQAERKEEGRRDRQDDLGIPWDPPERGDGSGGRRIPDQRAAPPAQAPNMTCPPTRSCR